VRGREAARATRRVAPKAERREAAKALRVTLSEAKGSALAAGHEMNPGAQP